MNIVTTLDEWRTLRGQLKNQGIGFVPTMGHLHAGHMALCNRSRQENDISVVSIFVNPTQFNQQNDFNSYPRTLDEDIELLTQHGIDYLFLPKADDLYPDDYQVKVTETELGSAFEGEHRPGHFDGMLTIVLKLLNIIRPIRTYFGEKDYQQYLLVKKMVQALFLDTKVIAVKTVRAEDGLALSSRNSRLSEENRKLAASFSQLLLSQLSIDEIKAHLTASGFKVDYIAEKWGRRLGAVYLGDVRLIDNVERK